MRHGTRPVSLLILLIDLMSRCLEISMGHRWQKSKMSYASSSHNLGIIFVFLSSAQTVRVKISEGSELTLT